MIESIAARGTLPRMFPCNACHRHIRETESQCPFCGAAQRLTSSTGARASSFGAFTFAAVAMFASGCGKDTVSADTGETSTQTTTTTTTTTDETSSGSTESTGTDTDTSTSDATITGGSFYAGPGIDFGGVWECDPFAQDCPDGEKCVPFATFGDIWDANKCVPVLGDGQVGDPCIYGGPVEATDDCGPESYCWNVTDMNGEQLGTCTAFCQGTADMPVCAMGTDCLIANQGSITLCIDVCDPLLQDCADGFTCNWLGDNFHCTLGGPGNGEGQPCDQSECSGELVCVTAAALPGCAGSACCTSFCALDDPNACPDPLLECVSYFEQGMAPAGYENVGICIAP
jgi:hypothetical protein